MKIGIVTNSISGGGAERQAAQWAAVIAGWPDAQLEVLSVHESDESYAVPDGVSMSYAGKRHAADVVRVARAIRRFARRMDVVIAFQPYPAIFCIGLRVPVLLVTGDDPRYHWDASGVPNRVIDAAFRNAAGASAPTPELIDCYRGLGIETRGAWHCVPNIVDAAGYATAPPGERAGVLFVGRLEDEKDPLLAVDVCVRAGAALTFLGDGTMREQVQVRGAGHDVRLPGFTAHPWEQYARSRALIVTSRNEAFGNVIVESLAAGTPVVSVDCDFGPRHVLAGARFSDVVDSRDPAVLADALRSVLDRPYGEDEERECREIAARYSPQAVEPLIREAVAATLTGPRVGRVAAVRRGRSRRA